MATITDDQLQALWRYLRHLGADPESAADLAQSALAVWWQRRQDIEPQRTGAFLRSTARNLWRNWLRARGRSLEVEWAEAVDAVWNGPLEPDQRLARLRDCVQRLGDRARTAVELVYRQDLGRAAVGDRLGMTADGVKTLLRRTRAALAECVRRGPAIDSHERSVNPNQDPQP